MQGRLVKDEKNLIQSFPYKSWKKEFLIANKLGLRIMEWTIDRKNILQNPIFKKNKIIEIKKISEQNSVKINSVTCDFFMQKPFFKIKDIKKRDYELSLLFKLINFSNLLGIKYIILPIVDNSSIINNYQEQTLIRKLSLFKTKLKKNKQMILFESDYEPKKLINFIKKFPKKCFGINYDLGNSSAYGFKLSDEKLYFKYVKNIHIKDRRFKGTTVRLGHGNADFKFFFSFLKKIKYSKNLILQTARAKNNVLEIKKNIKFLKKYI